MDKIRVALIAFSLVLFALLIAYAEPQKLVENLSTANPSYLLISIIFLITALLLRIYRWQMLIGELSFSEIAPIQLFGNALSNIAPAKASEPVKAVLLKSNYGVSLSKGFASTVVERISDLMAVLLISCLSLLYLPFYIALPPILVFGFALFVLVGSAQSYKIRSVFVGVVSRFSNGYAKSAERFIGGLKINREFMYALLTGMGIWILDSLTAIFVLFSLDASPNVYLPYLAISGLMGLSLLLGLLSLLPGGLGSMDLSFAVLLQMLGVDPSVSITSVLLYRLITFWSGIGIGLVASVFIKKKRGSD